MYSIETTLFEVKVIGRVTLVIGNATLFNRNGIAVLNENFEETAVCQVGDSFRQHKGVEIAEQKVFAKMLKKHENKLLEDLDELLKAKSKTYRYLQDC